MKKLFSIFMLVAIAAMTLVSCSKESDTDPINEKGVKMKTITVRTGIGTKTTLDSDHSKLQWTNEDKISLFNNLNTDNTEIAYPTGGGDITVTVPEETNEIYAHYPFFGGNEDGPTHVSVYISKDQTQKNPGELNGYYFPMVAKGTVSIDNKALISFYPVASALALNIYKSTLGDAETETVESVKVTPDATTNTGFIGRQYMNLTGSNLKYNAAEASNPITVTLTNHLNLQKSKPTDAKKFDGQIYVCLAKQSYAKVKFEIKTNKGKYTITSSDSKAFDLENNDFVPVSINLSSSGATFEENETPVDPTSFNWGLVKDELAIGDKVVIASAGSNFAMSTTQNQNNRSPIGITKSGMSLTANTDVQVFKVVAGSKENTFALKCLNGDEIGNFITAASSSNNYLRSTDEINDNASWNISINTGSGVAEIVAQGGYSRNTIKYNSTNSVFSCYSSGSSGLEDVVFYRPSLPSANLSFPELSYSANIGESFTAPTLNNPYEVTVTYASSNSAIASVDASTGAVTIGSTAGKATITASFDGNSSYLASEASYEIIVIDPNIEQWVKTSISSITSSDVFVIVGGGYAVTNDNGTSNPPAAIAVTITGDALTAEPAANLQWKLTGSASAGYSFSPAGDAAKYLYCTTNAESGSNNNIRVGTGNRKVWEFDSNGLMKTKDDYAVRYFSKYNYQDWRGYTSTSNGAVALEFYVKQGSSSTKTLSSISVSGQTTNFVKNETFIFGGTVTATYSDNSTTDVTDDAIFSGYNMSSTGTQTVTVSYTEGDVTKTTTYSITVSNEENVSFTWNQGSGVSSGYSFTMENGSNKSGYIQDKDGSTGIDLKIAKTNGTALFANTPSTITLTVKVGGGSTKDPLANNVIAYLIDNEGKNIAATQTTVTTKVENQTGTEYSVSMPVSQAYGIRISHVKESGYNVRIYSISFQAE